MASVTRIFSSEELKFKLPFGMIISGPTNSGKTTFLMRLLQYSKELMTPVPKTILYCYGEFHEFVPRFERNGILTHSGIPSDDLVKKLEKPLLLILDDLMLSANEKYIADLFTKKSHHHSIGIVFITQNLFEKNIKVARNNSQYIVLMRAPNSLLQIRNLGTQLFPNRRTFFLESYDFATENPYGYLLLDIHPSADPHLKLRTNIFPDDVEKIVFIPKNA